MSANAIVWKSIMGATNSLGNKIDFSKPTLITIGFSHFSEKARWLLNLSPLKYQEDRHLPAFHLARTLSPTVRNLYRVQMPGISVDEHDIFSQRKEKTAVPKLVLPVSYLPEEFASQVKPGELVCMIKDGSKGIAKYLTHMYKKEMDYLVPSSLAIKIAELDELLEKSLAPAVTTFVFGNFLLSNRNAFPDSNNKSLDLFIRYCKEVQDVPDIQRILISFLGKHLIIPAMIAGNKISAAAIARARNDIISIFEKVEALRNLHGCNESSNYVFNTPRPTLADISLASFTAPLLMPPETSHLYFDRKDIESLRTSTSGCNQYLELSDLVLQKYSFTRAVLRMYADKSLYNPQ